MSALLLGLALLPRVGPALRAYQPSPDAAEHLLIARSLAEGKGFQLPIRVRFHTAGPVEHEAYGERAPLYPWLLSLSVRAGLGRTGWPDPRLQLLGVLLASLCAGLAVLLTAGLGRLQGLRGRSLLWASLCGGLVVAWSPSLVRASIHLWAEPLGLLLVLGTLYLQIPKLGGRRSSPLLLGMVLGLARFARPEAWILVPLVVALELAGRRWQRALTVAGAVGLVNLLGVLATGVLAPQLFLLEVVSFEAAMDPAGVAAAPDLATVVAGVGRNLVSQLGHLIAPKNSFFVLPLALLGWRNPRYRPLFVAALAWVLATAGVWSTNDPNRFTIAPLCLLAPVAAVEVEVRRKRLWPGDPRPLAIYVVLLVGIMGHSAGRELRGRPPAGPPLLEAGALPAPPRLEDPWSYALLSGRPAILAKRAEQR